MQLFAVGSIGSCWPHDHTFLYHDSGSHAHNSQRCLSLGWVNCCRPRDGPIRKHCLQHFLHCVHICCHRKMFTEPLPSNGCLCGAVLTPLFWLSGIMSQYVMPLPKYLKYIFPNIKLHLKFSMETEMNISTNFV
jgi:hypothetical protein